MSGIVIKELRVTGQGRTTAKVDFRKGLNIICGPSDTGKSYIFECINYIFGGKTAPKLIADGYEYVEVDLLTDGGIVQLKREFNTNKIFVISTDKRYESNTIYAKHQKGKVSISTYILKMMGLNDDTYQVITDQDCSKAAFTFRTISQLFLLSEEKIISNKSIVFGGINTATTAETSAFKFLLSGIDDSEIDSKEAKKITAIRKEAIIDYISKELQALKTRKSDMDIEHMDICDLDKEITEYTKKMVEVESQIAKAAQNRKTFIQELDDRRKRYSEVSLLSERYNCLIANYTSDLDRLSFICDGDMNYLHRSNQTCPVCDGKIMVDSSDKKYVQSAKGEYKKITLQMKDLNKTIKYVTDEKEQLLSSIKELETKSVVLDHLLNTDLGPRMQHIKEKILTFKQQIENQKELEIIEDFAIEKGKDLIKAHLADKSESTLYKPREHFKSEHIIQLSEIIHETLKKWGYIQLSSAIFDLKTMDIMVDGKFKSDYGKGYRAFFNTLLSISVLKYLEKTKRASPAFNIIDSPILSFKGSIETDADGNEYTSEEMKKSLFEDLSQNYKGMQIIIIENDVPDIEFGDSHIVRFTKNKEHGRYGFFENVF